MADAGRELLILGILRRAPLSAYDVELAVRAHAPLFRLLKRGNVYYTLERLAAQRFLARRDVPAQRGRLATKAVYRIAAPGERRFRELLRATVLDLQAGDAALEIAYVLLGQLPRDETLALMQARHEAVQSQERRLRRLYGDVVKRGGAAYLSASHAFNRVRAEQRFLAESIALLHDAKWSPSWASDDGPIDPERRLR
ncbi:MAG TPA: PadR family transcriptional regulator [Candidatus Elarobacter sp.]|nr:PadR family transcriptional regulator [Candidatus Elarobacter sp.]